MTEIMVERKGTTNKQKEQREKERKQKVHMSCTPATANAAEGDDARQG